MAEQATRDEKVASLIPAWIQTDCALKYLFCIFVAEDHGEWSKAIYAMGPHSVSRYLFIFGNRNIIKSDPSDLYPLNC